MNVIMINYLIALFILKHIYISFDISFNYFKYIIIKYICILNISNIYKICDIEIIYAINMPEYYKTTILPTQIHRCLRIHITI